MRLRRRGDDVGTNARAWTKPRRRGVVRTAALAVAASLASAGVGAVGGGLDPGFDGDGRAITDLGASESARAVVVQPDGKVVVAGTRQVLEPAGAAGNNDFFLVRYNPDGTVDPAFGDSGRVVTDLGAREDNAFDLAIQADGRLVVAGLSGTIGELPSAFAVARYDQQGRLDSLFGNAGIVRREIGSRCGGIAVALGSRPQDRRGRLRRRPANRGWPRRAAPP